MMRGATERMAKRDTWCRHRTPFGNDYPVCKAGIDYHPFLLDYKRMPCLGETAEARALCTSYSGYTAEEIAKREADIQAQFTRIGIIRRAIIGRIAITGQHSDSLTCPCCKTGSVQYSQASNGHVHARCSTDGCASWME